MSKTDSKQSPESQNSRERGNRALVIVLWPRPFLRHQNTFKYSVFEASKLVSTKTLLLKHYFRRQGIDRFETPETVLRLVPTLIWTTGTRGPGRLFGDSFGIHQVRESAERKVPEFFFEFPPRTILRILLRIFPQIFQDFRALFPGKRRQQKIHQESPPFFNSKSPA